MPTLVYNKKTRPAVFAGTKNGSSARQAARVLKCLGHPLRLLLVASLSRHPLHVRQLEADLKLSQAVVSKHLAILRKGGVVSSRAHGRHRYYAVCHPRALKVLDCVQPRRSPSHAVLHN